jgi:hypothetical protein
VPPTKPPNPPRRPHDADRRAVKAILDEAREEELLRLAHSPDPLPTRAVVARLGAVEVQALDGIGVRLDSLWQHRPAAVVWLRHYG